MDGPDQANGAVPAEETDERAAPTSIEFEHKFFSTLDGCYFRVAEDTGEPVYVVQLSENNVTLPFRGIVREFEIAADSADGRMLQLIADALKYVRVLRVGDPLPSEVLTGQASWEVSEKHRQAALQRLTIQLVTWLSGGERLVTNPEELEQLADDPQTKARVTEAFSKAAGQLELDNDEAVVRLIEDLAEELAYIEALRERFGEILVMRTKVKKFRAQYRREQNMREVANSVYRLLDIAVEEFVDVFKKVDSLTSEIMAVLRDIEARVESIREHRDELFRRLVAWDETLASWRIVNVGEWGTEQETLRATYRFLAPRYTRGDEWDLYTKLQELDGQRQARSVMIW